jgi:hypothetical protein
VTLSIRALSEEQQQRLTGLLIEEIVAAPRGFVIDEWALLRGRTLTREQEFRLMEGLLEKRDKRGFLGAEDRQWMETMIQAGAVPEPLTTRFQEQ